MTAITLTSGPVAPEPGNRTALWSRRLERQLQRELNDASVDGGAADLAEARRIQTGVRIREVRVVQDVEDFRAEFHLLPLPNREALEDGKVHVELTGTAEHPNSRITPGAGWRLAPSGLVDVVVQIRVDRAGVDQCHAVDHVGEQRTRCTGGRTAQTLAAGRVGHRQRRTRLNGG